MFFYVAPMTQPPGHQSASTGPASSCELHAAAVGGADHGVILVEVQDVALDEVRQIAILTPGIKWMKCRAGRLSRYLLNLQYLSVYPIHAIYPIYPNLSYPIWSYPIRPDPILSVYLPTADS